MWGVGLNICLEKNVLGIVVNNEFILHSNKFRPTQNFAQKHEEQSHKKNTMFLRSLQHPRELVGRETEHAFERGRGDTRQKEGGENHEITSAAGQLIQELLLLLLQLPVTPNHMLGMRTVSFGIL
ncbi:hypothetical protein CDAR_399221 [Caerostris darwini]|uniref:Uncharacterized protein n=1 Tax=Caerostris darwini TaxID=1538125 RepID=A0AAV4SVS8_9ARAC|nr:hypothetical protein CDAR_399221 [Caerostris darwini]